MRKIYILIFCLAVSIFGIFSLTGCDTGEEKINSNPVADTVKSRSIDTFDSEETKKIIEDLKSYIDLSDEEIIKKIGEGKPMVYSNNGNILSREYCINILGETTYAYLSYSDEGVVTDIHISFSGNDFKDYREKLKLSIGEWDEAIDGDDDESIRMAFIWNYEETKVSIIKVYETVMIQIY